MAIQNILSDLERVSLYEEYQNLVCDVCDKWRPESDMSKLDFWNHKYCKIHEFDETPQCYGCDRYKASGSRYINLRDDEGRKLCLDCHSVAIMDDQNFNLVIGDVHEFFKCLNLEIKDDIPILLVDREEMNIAVNMGIRADASNTHCSGLTTFHVQIVNKVSRFLQSGDDIRIVKKPHQLKDDKVTSILILCGMTNVMTGSVLAHEIMHTWFRYQGYENLKPEIAEGMCEVISHKWLEWLGFLEGDYSFCSTSEQAQFANNLREYEIIRTESSSDSIYGHGFREAKWAVEKFGLEDTLEHIAENGNLPE